MGEPSEPDVDTLDTAAERPTLTKRVWPVLKWSLFGALLLFVGWRAWKLWSAEPDAFANLDWQPWWLVPSAAAYVVGWIPSVWFWRLMLARIDRPVGVADASRAYYCGHLGKYIPGKALVLVIRAALLKDRGVRPGAAALTAAYETLAMMAVGGALGVALAPSVLPVSFWEKTTGPLAALWQQGWFRTLWTLPGAVAGIVLVVSVGVLPLLAKLASVAAVKMVPANPADEPVERRPIDTGLFATGMAALFTGWWIHGLSLGCVVMAVGGTSFDLSQWPAWTSAVSLATSAGFVAIFAPGGAGIRELVLIEVLRVQPDVSAQAAVAASFLLRVVWLVTEVVAAALLYWGVRRVSTEPTSAAKRTSSPPPVERAKRIA